MGMFTLGKPWLDPIRYEQALWKFYAWVGVPRYSKVTSDAWAKELDNLQHWFDNRSVKQHLLEFAPEELVKEYEERL